MDPQKKFAVQIAEINESLALQATGKISKLLAQLGQNQEDFKLFTTELTHPSTPIHINFQHWSNFARMLIKASSKFINNQINQNIAQYILRAAHHFIPYELSQSNFKVLSPLLKISKPLKFQKPNLEKINSKHLALYLQAGEWDKNWEVAFIQVINTQVLIDKKNQTANMIKVNPLMGQFISKNFAIFLPQLERLMVRSENNIEILCQFFQSCGDSLKDIGEGAVNLLKKYKNIYQSKPELGWRFVKSLTRSLNQENHFYQAFDFIKGLISTQHNVKRKIIYFRHLEGIIEAHRRFNHSSKIINEVVVCIIVNWAKFTEQAEALLVFQLLNQALPLITEPGPEIAEQIKPSLKSQNKFILTFSGLTLSFAYKKEEHLEEFGSVKECNNVLKSLVGGFFKKKQSSWHFLLPILNFLSTFDIEVLQDLTEIQSLFKKSVLALQNIQQKDALNLITAKYFGYLEKISESQSFSISQNVCGSVVLLLENLREKTIWESVCNKIKDKQKVQILEKGIFPLIFVQHESGISKNKGNKYISLTRYLFNSINDTVEIVEYEKFIKLLYSASYSNYSFEKLMRKIKVEKEIVQEASENLIVLSLTDSKFRQQNQKQYINPSMHQNNLKSILNVLKLASNPGLGYINDILQKLLNPDYYEKDRTFIANFESKQKSTRNSLFEKVVNPCKNLLTEMEMYVESKIPKRKIYLSALLDSKMMSEAEVKQQQYRQHFEKMLSLFNQIIVNIIIKNIKNFIKEEEKGIWSQNIDGFIHIVSYPEHRVPVYRIVKATFQNFSAQHKKGQEEIHEKIQKLFLRYSNFFADFYSIRGAHLTPPVHLMGRAQKFYSEFLNLDYSILNRNQFSIKFINDLSLYVLENMQFDLSVKEQALNFFYSCIQKKQELTNIQNLFTFIVKNLNIISNSTVIQNVLQYSMKSVNSKRYGQLFVEILNYINKTKKLILKVLLNLSEHEGSQPYEPTFEDYIKLRILALDDSSYEEISKYAQKILSLKEKNSLSISSTISTFDMRNFVKNNTKDTIQKLCKFMKESITPENIDDVFTLVLKTSEQLFDENFDQEGLQFLPYFLSLNLQIIPQKFLHRIFEVFIIKYTSKANYVTLSKMSVDTGIDIIKYHAAKSGEKMLLSMQSFLSKAKGISNIVFLGVLAPYLKGNKNLNVIEKRITELFKSDSQSQQCSIAKCMPDLMSFFKNPEEIISKIFEDMSKIDEKTQLGQAYLASGLIKGVGHKKMAFYLEKLISQQYPSKTKGDKIGRCQFFRAFIENFGRVVELKSLKIIDILLNYMSDSNEQVRNWSKTTVQIFVTKMSSFSIKNLLPQLLSGLDNQQNWRIKISYIWILGIMANCSAKQLQTSLPSIVPTLSACLSNAHPTIRQKASQALSLIGETIKNPQISNSIDVLIQALQNPFEKSTKAIEILLKTRFSHYIDPPSLSLIVPIIDYCLRGRVSELKEGACQVIGSITQLILNPSDMLPYLRFVAPGLKTVLCDPLSEIRSVAAMAIGRISTKIGPESAKHYFSFVYDLISSSLSNTTQKTGAAQAYAQILCSQGYDYFEQSINEIFAKLSEPAKSIPKEGYILVFLYIPGIRRQQFQGFIKEVNQNTYCYVSDEDDALRNSSMQVSKVLINNYGISHTELLLYPLCDGIFESNWRKRNAALILLGELLNILKLHMFQNRNNQKIDYYYQALMAVYIQKDDDLEMPRQTANFVWNTYIENTPKTIRCGLNTLVKMWTKFTQAAEGVVEKNITSFAVKYGQNYFTQILQYLEEFSKLPQHQEGVYRVMGEFFKKLTQQFLGKPSYRSKICKFFENNIFTVDGIIRKAFTDCFSLYIQKMHQYDFFQNLVFPRIDEMGELSQQNPQYTNMLHLLRDLLHNTTSAKVIDRLIGKVTQNPLSEFKIEVITNNTDKIANNLYSSFKTPATQGMLDEIISLINNPAKSTRLALLVYCMDQVSIRLQSKYKNHYINMLTKYLRVYRNKKDEISKESYFGIIQKLLQMIVFFLNSIDLNDIQSLDELVGDVSPHIFHGSKSMKIHSHKIFTLLISDHKSTKTGSYYKQMIVSLDNQHSESENKHTVIWNEQQTLRDYINILVKGLVYGNHENIEDGIEMVKFIIKNSDPELLSGSIAKILGPVVRVSSYPLFQRQKQKLLDFIKELYQNGYKGALQIYNYQVVSVCIRILNQSKLGNKKTNDLTQEVSKTLFNVIAKQSNNRNRQLLLNFILEKAKGQILAEVAYSLVNEVISQNRDILSENCYTKLKGSFKKMLLDTETKIGVKGVYFICKTISLVQSISPKESVAQSKQILTYQDLILYLQRSSYKKEAVPKIEKLELLIKQSPRQKVFYILKSLHECCLANTRTEQIYTSEYIKSLVPEALSGFQDIVEILEYFD